MGSAQDFTGKTVVSVLTLLEWDEIEETEKGLLNQTLKIVDPRNL